MVWLAGLITLISIVLWVYAFFDALTCPADEARNLPKLLWLVVIVLFVPVGALLWLFLGRPKAATTSTASARPQPAPNEPMDPSDPQPPSGRSHPLGPDDDPEFLRRLNKRINPDD
ncbi:hypothetical protein CDO52_25585 [Nocardiopsis gilva YIM 90087]|uniref:Cardiolipin synthase N-terminal domain-containing protein n=1 Tax=Nocardiopsis gilva YIM 90087 TaxID=1235441 RepID=A0A223SC43_9ACTN|nr:PLD nuclease N-terminal domain-containing protein [Nocardiopsis gilva]ASU85728.1 hypothetical protein CDO52_25585 [Nocardiopsis gilva YIM 90087]